MAVAHTCPAFDWPESFLAVCYEENQKANRKSKLLSSASKRFTSCPTLSGPSSSSIRFYFPPLSFRHPRPILVLLNFCPRFRSPLHSGSYRVGEVGCRSRLVSCTRPISHDTPIFFRHRQHTDKDGRCISKKPYFIISPSFDVTSHPYTMYTQ